MTRHLLTPSLYDAYWRFTNTDFKPFEEWMDTLNKVRGPKTEAMQNGIDFEDRIEELVRTGVVPEHDARQRPYWDCVAEVAGIVKGGSWQDKLSKEVTIDGNTYLLYGKSDVIKRDWIYDIKFSKRYEIGKYQKSIQHLCYMYMTGIKRFAYLVSDGKTVYREDYFWDETSEPRLMGELKELTSYILTDARFAEAYRKHWETKY